ncbi:hypothetical protein CNR33_00005 [Pseudomonas phage tabernarius]|uniref:Uncharacterized protein n=1 Tax=Pseudomonas phage tabernarius TaxID=2048978 RepID=A0A2H4P6P5_9CAUD|nr:hypothetical protein FDJ17_gp05 [Pseudomonas phage tabernarius]ATW57851.1 hypothetical protein CNR33_00005 [Pseudomonas phage tabernarius]
MKQPTFPANELDCLFLLAVMLMSHRNNPAKLRHVAKLQVKNVPRSTRPAFAMIALSKNPAAVIQSAIENF